MARPSRTFPERVTHATELFAPLGHIRVKAMFGGWGFYCDDLFFAIVAHDTLYLKADAGNADQFRAAGGTPFTYAMRDGSTQTMNYWTVPEEAMETPGGMRPWAQFALAAAVQARKPAKARSKRR